MQDEPQSEDPASQASGRLGWTLAGKWTLKRVIGIGGMAAVYEAQHRNQSRVAIKMLHSELSRDAAIRRRFLQEGYAGNSVHHPGVPRVLDDDIAGDGSAFLVMDLLEGRSLEDALEDVGRLHPAHALMVADQVLDVLEVAHARGVIHRDIKPDNIFITSSGEVKLLDFGIARVKAGSSKGTTMGSFMGTPAYCSPEQARGRWSEVDERTDLWALGATLFNALTGRAVHQAETPTEQLALAVHACAPAIHDVDAEVPQAFGAVIDRVLRYEKEERFSSATEFREAIAEASESVEAPHVGLAALALSQDEVSHHTSTLVARTSRSRLRLDSGSGMPGSESEIRRQADRGSVTGDTRNHGTPSEDSASRASKEAPPEVGNAAPLLGDSETVEVPELHPLKRTLLPIVGLLALVVGVAVVANRPGSDQPQRDDDRGGAQETATDRSDGNAAPDGSAAPDGNAAQDGSAGSDEGAAPAPGGSAGPDGSATRDGSADGNATPSQGVRATSPRDAGPTAPATAASPAPSPVVAPAQPPRQQASPQATSSFPDATSSNPSQDQAEQEGGRKTFLKKRY